MHRYWNYLERIVKTHEIIIDRPKGSHHPRFNNRIYPIDYGYLKDTTTVDGNGIDIFVGSLKENAVQGIFCTADILKNDTEIKILYNCTNEEIESIKDFIESKYMSGIFIRNENTGI